MEVINIDDSAEEATSEESAAKNQNKFLVMNSTSVDLNTLPTGLYFLKNPEKFAIINKDASINIKQEQVPNDQPEPLLKIYFRDDGAVQKYKTIIEEICKSLIFGKKSTHFSAAESALKVYDIEIEENSTENSLERKIITPANKISTKSEVKNSLSLTDAISNSCINTPKKTPLELIAGRSLYEKKNTDFINKTLERRSSNLIQDISVSDNCSKTPFAKIYPVNSASQNINTNLFNLSCKTELMLRNQKESKSIVSSTPEIICKKNSRQNNKKPEYLILSSDEEVDVKKKQAVECSETKKPKVFPIVKSDLDKNLNHSGSSIFNNFIPEEKKIEKYEFNVEQVSQVSSTDEARLEVRSVRIGSFKFSPKEMVHISLQGIKLIAPLSKDKKTCVEINISDFDLIKILGHFSKNMSVIFIKTSLKFSKQIRDHLGMEDPEKGPYFDPYSDNPKYQIITLLFESIDCEAKKIFTQNYKFSSISLERANKILLDTSPV